MATSSYYRIMRDNKKSEAKKYKRWAEKIEKILGKLRKDLSDNQNDINRKLAEIQEELEDGVREVPVFQSNARLLDEHVERSVQVDPHLSNAEESLDREAKDLRKKQEDAEDEAERFDQLYEEAKEEEAEERRRQREEIMNALSGK